MRILVIGGGIIGASCAALLAERGATVRVVDAGAPQFGTSLQNAGHIVVSHSVPFAAPGMVRAGLRSLLTSDGAFALASRPGLGTADWLIQFARHCTKTNVEELHPGLDELLHRSAELLTEDDTPRTGTGLWQVFTGEGAQERADGEARHLRDHDVQVRDVSIDELRSDPALTNDVRAGIELTEDFSVDPAALWLRMRQRSETAGAVWEEGTVLDVSRTPVITTADGSNDFPCDAIVIAAGSWSPSVARSVGIDLPIKAAKGYSVTVSGADSLPRHPMLLMDQRTAVNAIGDQLRLSARYELTTPDDRSIVHHRIAGLIDRARRALRLPEDLHDVQPWTGVRPASADGAPYIGPLPRQRSDRPRVLMATGHGMIGTALAAGTADLITRHIFDETVSDAETQLGPQRLLA